MDITSTNGSNHFSMRAPHYNPLLRFKENDLCKTRSEIN